MVSPRLPAQGGGPSVGRSQRLHTVGVAASSPASVAAGAPVGVLPDSGQHPRRGAGKGQEGGAGHLRRAARLPPRQAARHASPGDVPQRQPV